MDKMQKFYEGLFGWRFSDMGDAYMGYRVIITGDNSGQGPATHGINGGMTKRPGDAPTATQTAVNAFVNIVAVTDTDAMYAKALSLGGGEAMAPHDVPNVGRMAYIKDPEFNVFGIITPAMPPGAPAV
jgi:predicted enzyme related to lactoylglutathione lyase